MPTLLRALAAVASLALVAGCAASSGEPTASSDQHLTGTEITSLCGAGDWDGILPSFAQLARDYARETPGEGLQSIRFYVEQGAPGEFRTEGVYTAKFAGDAGAEETGSFSALPDNPAFSTSIFLQPTPGTGRVFYNLGVQRSADGTLAKLCLSEVKNAAAPEKPFVLARVEPGADAGVAEDGGAAEADGGVAEDAGAE